MPKRKKASKTPDYTGLPRHEDIALVQKSTPLLSLGQTPLSLSELKILDAYLSRIDSHDEEKRYVRFKAGELEKYLGVSRIQRAELDKRLKNLFQVVRIVDPDRPKGFALIGLFEKAEAVQDEETGLWQVDLVCTPSALEYVFNIEHMGYLRYRLKNIIGLQSRYSYILFLYILDNRFRESWDISVSELRKILHAESPTYNEFKRFRNLVLNPAVQELHEKTDLRFSFESIRVGRRIGKIRFTVETQADIGAGADQVEGQMSLEDYLPMDDSPTADRIGFLAEICRPDRNAAIEFSRPEMELLYSMLTALPESVLPDSDDPNVERDLWRIAKYLELKYSKLQVEAGRRKIEHRFAYLCKMIKADLKEDSGEI